MRIQITTLDERFHLPDISPHLTRTGTFTLIDETMNFLSHVDSALDRKYLSKSLREFGLSISPGNIEGVPETDKYVALFYNKEFEYRENQHGNYSLIIASKTFPIRKKPKKLKFPIGMVDCARKTARLINYESFFGKVVYELDLLTGIANGILLSDIAKEIVPEDKFFTELKFALMDMNYSIRRPLTTFSDVYESASSMN